MTQLESLDEPLPDGLTLDVLKTTIAQTYHEVWGRVDYPIRSEDLIVPDNVGDDGALLNQGAILEDTLVSLSGSKGTFFGYMAVSQSQFKLTFVSDEYISTIVARLMSTADTQDGYSYPSIDQFNRSLVIRDYHRFTWDTETQSLSLTFGALNLAHTLTLESKLTKESDGEQLKTDREQFEVIKSCYIDSRSEGDWIYLQFLTGPMLRHVLDILVSAHNDPENSFNFGDVRFLNMAYSDLYDYPDQLSNFKHIETLILTQTNIGPLPETFNQSNFPRLNELNFCNNWGSDDDVGIRQRFSSNLNLYI